jgi:hypothetical protein
VRAYLYVVAVLWVAPIAFLVWGVLFLPDENANGQCEGIGFGCTPTPSDSAELALTFLTPVLLIVGVVALLTLQRLRTRSSGFRAAWPVVQAAAVVGAVAVVGGALVAAFAAVA